MNSLYDKARQAFLDGTLSWTGGAVKAVLIDTSFYSVGLDVDEFLSSIARDARVKESLPLEGKTSDAGVAGANDAVFSLVPRRQEPVTAIVLYQAAGTDEASRLIAYLDDVVGLPQVPSGGDIVIRWKTEKIFKL